MTHVSGCRALRYAAWLAVPLLAVSACAGTQAKPPGPHHAAPAPATVTPLNGLTSQSPRGGSVRNRASSQLTGLSGARLAQRLRLVRTSEIRLATIDAWCQAKTGLAAAASKAQHVAELPYEKQYAGDLKAYAAGMRHAAEVAAAVLKQAHGLS